jgi:GT2 family glycosyltransferase
MDVCVVLYRSDTRRVEPGLRPGDRLITVDNTIDNVGFAAGSNLAAARGSDELICFVNPDGDLTPECLDRLESALEDPSLVAVGPNLGRRMNQRLLDDGSPAFLSGCCLMVRRAAFERVGGFDERLFMYGEDVDLSWKLRRIGRLRRVEDAHYPHDWSDSSTRFASLHRNFRNHLVVMRRHTGDSGSSVMVRDAIHSFRRGHLATGAARLTGIADYAVRARGWA